MNKKDGILFILIIIAFAVLFILLGLNKEGIVPNNIWTTTGFALFGASTIVALFYLFFGKN